MIRRKAFRHTIYNKINLKRRSSFFCWKVSFQTRWWESGGWIRTCWSPHQTPLRPSPPTGSPGDSDFDGRTRRNACYSRPPLNNKYTRMIAYHLLFALTTHARSVNLNLKGERIGTTHTNSFLTLVTGSVCWSGPIAQLITNQTNGAAPLIRYLGRT